MEQLVFKVRQINNVLEFEGTHVDFIKSYFRLDDNLPLIISEISRDSFIKRALQAFPGLRIVRQNPWECLISYICATYKNIPAIKDMIFGLSKRFGDNIAFENHDFCTFPEPDVLANAALDELKKCKLGYRAKRIQETARMVSTNAIDIEALKEVDYETAKGELLRFPGVGNKVADCVLLFSLEKLQAFPVDVWMKRIVQWHYTKYFDATFITRVSEEKALSSKAYTVISLFARNYFGEYAGYAQEYLFHFIRSRQT